MKKIYIGAAYYPELWNETEIVKDIERCKQLGINTLRVGEFAWAKMEPEEGVFDFGWLKEVVDKLYESGIYTVMCTPTATPPRWLFNKYPETRKVMNDLIRAGISSRHHTCKTSEIFRDKTRIIVTEMAKAFAGHKGIIGWQIDNELFPYGDGCFCENCKAAFRSYLSEKFGSIENLNQSWGMMRWSLCYSDFDDIEKVLVSEEQLKAKVAELGAQISKDYEGKNLVLVSILKGSVVFMADLMRAVSIPCSIDFMVVSSYGGSNTTSSGLVKIIKDLDGDLSGKDVLIVEDILDTGVTLSNLVPMLKMRNPNSVKICTILDKPSRRKADIQPDYEGYQVPDEFVVGYGLDYDEKYRNLPYVGVLKPAVYEK